MKRAKIKNSEISSEFGEIIEENKKFLIVSWNGVTGIYTKTKNEIEYKEFIE